VTSEGWRTASRRWMYLTGLLILVGEINAEIEHAAKLGRSQ
jgi:hypothetical protein